MCDLKTVHISRKLFIRLRAAKYEFQLSVQAGVNRSTDLHNLSTCSPLPTITRVIILFTYFPPRNNKHIQVIQKLYFASINVEAAKPT